MNISLCAPAGFWQNGRGPGASMRQRNNLLALALLALFAASGVWYFRVYVEPKPFGIVLFTGEGLVPSRLTIARLYDGGADRRLAINSLPSVALLSTHAADFAVADAAAAASALACGAKVNNRALSTDPAGKALPTILELARHRGRAVGLVTNGQLTDAAPAAFYAHTVDARDHAPLASQLAANASLDVVLGGGGGDFLPGNGGGRRTDGRDLVREMTAGGRYTALRTRADLQAVQPWHGRLLGLFAPDALAFHDQLPVGNSTQPSLAEMVGMAIETLQRRAGGYLLVVDAGLVGRAALGNQTERVLEETLELDHAVSVALQYAGTKTLVIVAGGEATGGMALNGYPLRQDRGVSLLGGMNAQGFPSITWATGPAGPAPAPGVNADFKTPAAPAAFAAPYADNTAEDAIAAGFGPGSERLRGFVDNTFVFDLIRSQL